MAPGAENVRVIPMGQPAPAPAEAPYGPPPPPSTPGESQGLAQTGSRPSLAPLVGPTSFAARDPSMAAGMTETGKKLKALQDEIQSLRAEKGIATGDRLHEVLERLHQLEEAGKHIRDLQSLEIQRQDFLPLVGEATSKIVSGALDGNVKDYEEGLSLKKTLERYAAVEGTVQQMAHLYPANSRFVFETDFTDANPAVRGIQLDSLEPSIDFLSKLPVIVELGEGKRSSDPKRREEASAVEALFSHLRVARASETKVATPASLEAETAALEGLVLPSVATFLARVTDRQNEKDRANPGFRARMEIESCLTALGQYSTFERVFEGLDRRGLGDSGPDELAQIRQFFVGRAWSYKRYVDAELVKVRSLKERAAAGEIITEVEVEGRKIPLTIEAEEERFKFCGYHLEDREAELARKSEEVGRLIVRLRTMTIGEDNIRESYETLKREFPIVVGHEEAHLRSLLSTQIAQVEQIPSDETGLEKIKADFGVFPSSGLSDRLKSYRDISSRLDAVSLRRLIDARITMYESYQKEVKISDNIKWAFALMGKGSGGDFPAAALMAPTDGTPEDLDPQQRKMFDPVIRRYQRIRELLNSGDPAKVQEARTLFTTTEKAGGCKQWESIYRDAATFNQYTIGLGIVTAAALTAYVGSAFLAPYVAESTVAAEVLFGTNVAIFTGTETLLHGIVYEHAPTAEEFGLKLATNAAMFKYIGKAMTVYEQIFGKSVVGAFAWEMVAFQGWEFYPALAKSIVANWDKGIGVGFDRAAEQGLSAKAWGNSFAFLLGMKIMFHAGKTPADAFLQSREAAALQREVQQMGEAMRDFMERPDGDPVVLLQRYQSVLRLQREFLKKDEVANREALGENERLQRQVDDFPKTSKAFVGLFGEGNRFGIKLREAGGPISYRPIWRAEIVKSLRALFGDSVTVHPNGLIEVGELRFVPARGGPRRHSSPVVPQLAEAQ